MTRDWVLLCVALYVGVNDCLRVASLREGGSRDG